MSPENMNHALRIGVEDCPDRQHMEFHINARLRKLCGLEDTLFSSTGNVIFVNLKSVHLFVQKYNKQVDGAKHPEMYLKAGQLNAMGLIDEIFHYVCRLYRQKANATFFSGAISEIEDKIGKESLNDILFAFTEEFPPLAVYKNKEDSRIWLAGKDENGIPNRDIALEELMLLRLANENPAFKPFYNLFSDKALHGNTKYLAAWEALESWSLKNPPFGPEGFDLISMLRAPVKFSPDDLKGQLDYIRTRWITLLGDWLARLLSGIDLISEEEKAAWSGGIGSGTPDMAAYEFGDISREYERFSPDREWMPNVVLLAKSVLVWLSQLSAKYRRPITRLDQIPDEELDFIAQAGFTGLWLIGLWERSPASARIKQICGNPEAAASAYSLDDYEIASELGGWDAMNALRVRAWQRGIRMASDMVPNHTGMDAKWVVEKPDLFVQTKECPFPGYDFNGENLSHDGRVGIYLENHYYSKSDCAVVFKRVDNNTGDTRYIYHGNDGTGMPWNDTAQVDFLNPLAREEVIQKILHVAKNFPIIRFDAAMVLAKKHIQRLWYPEPGQGGDIASRSQSALPRDEFERRIPEEFWREVVDRCAREIPDTLLLAEAFWMMEGYFVRTLGMHRVYNSAFMNMLKREDNAKYRTTIKNTIEFDPEILKRYVNFMNNPDEETASVQFGNGDKYFGVCTMMVAMPGLPMFGHGQVEGFEEKYGMEYRKAYKDEPVNEDLVNRHRNEIFPLMKKRYLFAGVENFLLYDFYSNGSVNENVFAWSNRVGKERAVILFNNVYAQASGWIRTSAASAIKQSDGSKQIVRQNIAEGLGLTNAGNRFCIMQEQRSGLWYIKTTQEIFESGIFAALNGFQTQAFVNIYEIDDNEWGHYRTLYESLKGRGIADVFMGIQNIFLKNLYASITAFASPEYFGGIRSLAETAPNPKSAAKRKHDDPVGLFIRKTEKTAKEFFRVFNEFIDGSYGAQTVKGIGRRKKTSDIDIVWTSFASSLEKLLRVEAFCKKAPASLRPESVTFLRSIKKRIDAQPEMLEVYGAVLILQTVRNLIGIGTSGETARDLISLWSLDIKMADILADCGLSRKAMLQRMHDFKEMQVLPDKDPETAPVVQTLFTSPSMQHKLGIHNWDGIRWFNKEGAEEQLECFYTIKAITGLKGKKKPQAFSSRRWNRDLRSAAKAQKTILALYADSGYKVEALLSACANSKKRNWLFWTAVTAKKK
jgi:glycosidase